MYAVVVIGAIALAIACNTAVGSVLEGILLQPLPYANADRLVNTSYDVSTANFSYLDARDLRAQQRTLEAFGVRHGDFATLNLPQHPVTVSGVGDRRRILHRPRRAPRDRPALQRRKSREEQRRHLGRAVAEALRCEPRGDRPHAEAR